MHKVWLYAPGENASKWDVCLSQNIMCIGWDEMGNLLEYASKKEMAARLQEIYDKPEASFKNDSLALWEFAHEMQAGDIVIVKKGQNQIIGRGIVKSDYTFDDSFSDSLGIDETKDIVLHRIIRIEVLLSHQLDDVIAKLREDWLADFSHLE